MYQLTRAFVVALLLAALPTCAQDRAASDAATEEEAGTHVGVVARNLEDQPCLRVGDSSLTPGMRFEASTIPVVGWSDSPSVNPLRQIRATCRQKESLRGGGFPREGSTVCPVSHAALVG